MKLAAIYNVWDNWEMLEPSIESIRADTELVVVVAQRVSNWGQSAPIWQKLFLERLNRQGLIDRLIWIEPNYKEPKWQLAQAMEKAKRQAGIDFAVQQGCTHFVSMDSDEFYREYEFHFMREWIAASPIRLKQSFACSIQVYYKSPNLKLDELDETYVPFICPLPAKTGGVKNCNLLIDPTRRTAANYHPLNFAEIKMHHFSWVRKGGIQDKLRNSTARMNIYKPAIIKEWEKAEAGTVLAEIYRGKRLIECKNEFLPEDW